MSNQIVALSFDSMASPKIYVSNIHLESDWSSITRGMGILWYPNDIKGAAVVKDFMMMEEPMCSSSFLVFSSNDITAETPISDLQPFLKPYGGRDWIWGSFPHMNAKNFANPALDKSVFQPVGNTISESTFCYFLHLLYQEGIYSIKDIPLGKLNDIIRQITLYNSSSFIVSEGDSFFVYRGKTDKDALYSYRVYNQYRGVKYEKERLVFSISDPLDDNKTVMMISNTPLSGDQWDPIPPQHCLIIRKGQLISSIPIEGNEIRDTGAAVAGSQIKEDISSPLLQGEFAQEKRFLHYQDHPLLVHQRKVSTKPKTLSVRHHTVYSYTNDVEYSSHILRLHPLEDINQKVLDFKFTISGDTNILHFEDVFGNQSLNFILNTPYRELAVTTESIIEIPPSTIDFSHPLRQILIPLFWTPWQRQMMSPYLLPIELPESELKVLSDYAMSFVERNHYNLLDTVLNINDTIYRDYKYTPGFTNLYTTPFQVFSTRKGVCQDFASLFICLARLLNIPARYRVGYIYTGGDYENKTQSDASHAWVELYLPNIGWLGFDPTNDVIANQDHVRVACGRNYLDATPTSGTIYKGGAGETLFVDVKVTEIL